MHRHTARRSSAFPGRAATGRDPGAHSGIDRPDTFRFEDRGVPPVHRRTVRRSSAFPGRAATGRDPGAHFGIYRPDTFRFED